MLPLHACSFHQSSYDIKNLIQFSIEVAPYSPSPNMGEEEVDTRTEFKDEKCMFLPPIKLWHQEPNSIEFSIQRAPHPPSPNMGGRRGWYEDKIQREEKCMCLPPIKLWHQEPDSIREPPPTISQHGRKKRLIWE